MPQLNDIRSARAAAIQREASRLEVAQEFIGDFPNLLRVHVGKPEADGGITFAPGHQLEGNIEDGDHPQGQFPFGGSPEQWTATLRFQDQGTEYRIPFSFSPAPQSHHLLVSVGQNDPVILEVTIQDYYEHHKELAEAVANKIVAFLQTCVHVPPVVTL
jgi:hypothetical protein